MPMINFAEPLSLLVALVLYVLLLWFAYQSKKSIIAGMTLFGFLTTLILHTVEYTMGSLSAEGLSATVYSIVFDFIFVFLSFISYLWIDDIEAKANKKKSIDNSLDWFWSKI